MVLFRQIHRSQKTRPFDEVHEGPLATATAIAPVKSQTARGSGAPGPVNWNCSSDNCFGAKTAKGFHFVFGSASYESTSVSVLLQRKSTSKKFNAFYGSSQNYWAGQQIVDDMKASSAKELPMLYIDSAET
ncbi:predicted protein [Aspergillus nidulans FGSC A4]|uniref:Uncharacterized protein n=1 Tax=Emericella nidulans (strain FGSC A4 / ATCC 38163 / CBS 112.46 / NRRL 194 / M139) TaxID=227321 RepID=Q5ARD5_EMENI|nr:hypothetical protein [Aspergillus nidulans FGSC A4]EAA61978.1 predicted protein [Aspergillus nidulans FGSC A4]CBF82456.1 TPA: conserved hypothetical protein [Aspergillus nidulans FGSC A4]|eukprot:XP_682414.1 predicted protein [Aspergillus nidulans FGSC A4]